MKWRERCVPSTVSAFYSTFVDRICLWKSRSMSIKEKWCVCVTTVMGSEEILQEIYCVMGMIGGAKTEKCWGVRNGHRVHLHSADALRKTTDALKGPIYAFMDSGYFYVCEFWNFLLWLYFQAHGFNCAFSSLFLIFNHKSIRNSALSLIGRKRSE